MQAKDKINIINADLTKLQVDAIVNAANNSLMGGGGVDGAIHRAAGPELKQYCATLKGCATGNAKITPGFNLPVKYIIHAVGPVWNNGTRNEEQLLASCYQKSMELSTLHQCMSIAFPCISTGAYRFPFDKACRIALHTIHSFLQAQPLMQKVLLVTFDQTDFQLYQREYEKYFYSSAQ